MTRIVFISAVFSLFVLATIAPARTYEGGTVLKWENRPYSQSAHISRNQIVYSVRVGAAVYQIARRREKVEMSVGQELKCRIEEDHFFVLNEKGKEMKYEIVGTEQVPISN